MDCKSSHYFHWSQEKETINRMRDCHPCCCSRCLIDIGISFACAIALLYWCLLFFGRILCYKGFKIYQMWAPWNLLANCWMLLGIGVSMVSIVSPFTLLSLLNCIDGSGQYNQDKRQNEANNKTTLISHDLIAAAYGALIEGTTNSNPGFVCAAGSCWTWSVFFVTCLQKLDSIDAMYSQWLLYQLIAKSQWTLNAIWCVYQ